MTTYRTDGGIIYVTIEVSDVLNGTTAVTKDMVVPSYMRAGALWIEILGDSAPATNVAVNLYLPGTAASQASRFTAITAMTLTLDANGDISEKGNLLGPILPGTLLLRVQGANVGNDAPFTAKLFGHS